MIAYRMQAASRDIAELLDPEQQWSFPVGGQDDLVRRGVSGCETLGDLAAYLAVNGIMATRPVLVRIEGPASPDAPCDVGAGEVLLLPESATLIKDDKEFFTLVSDLVDLHWERGLGVRELQAVAADRI